MPLRYWFSLIIGLLGLFSIASAEVYRCVVDGQTSFQSTPCDRAFVPKTRIPPLPRKPVRAVPCASYEEGTFAFENGYADCGDPRARRRMIVMKATIRCHFDKRYQTGFMEGRTPSRHAIDENLLVVDQATPRSPYQMASNATQSRYWYALGAHSLNGRAMKFAGNAGDLLAMEPTTDGTAPNSQAWYEASLSNPEIHGVSFKTGRCQVILKRGQ